MRFLGMLLIVSPIALIFSMMVKDMGWKDALIASGIATLMVLAVLVGMSVLKTYS